MAGFRLQLTSTSSASWQVMASLLVAVMCGLMINAASVTATTGVVDAHGVLALQRPLPPLPTVPADVATPTAEATLAQCGVPQGGDSQAWAVCVVNKVGVMPIVLPDPFTPTDAASQQLYDSFVQMMDQAIALLSETQRTDQVLGDVGEFLRSLQSAVAAIKVQLDTAVAANDCGALLQAFGDATIRVPDPTLCARIKDGEVDLPRDRPQDGPATLNAPLGDTGIQFKDFVQSPFLPLPPFGSPFAYHPHEEARSKPVERGGSYLVVKEVFGLKLRLVYSVVPIWVEPWYPRRHIVGYKRVWTLRWVPCEFIKSVIHGSQAGLVQAPTVSAVEFCDSRLLSYWRWFGPHYRPVPIPTATALA